MYLCFYARLLRHCDITLSIRDFEVRPKDRHLTALKPSFLIFKTGLIIPTLQGLCKGKR